MFIYSIYLAQEAATFPIFSNFSPTLFEFIYSFLGIGGGGT
jgi:hypothetical protein